MTYNATFSDSLQPEIFRHPWSRVNAVDDLESAKAIVMSRLFGDPPCPKLVERTEWESFDEDHGDYRLLGEMLTFTDATGVPSTVAECITTEDT